MTAERKQVENANTSEKNGSESGGGETGRKRKGDRGFEMGSENLLENGADLDGDDRNLKQHSPLEPKSTNWSSFAKDSLPRVRNPRMWDSGREK
ncbi:hypothetical protein GH733_013193 [Mirounga leonina]|nr:hypothetical protein GH733_013193 [Mirounga leonina]